MARNTNQAPAKSVLALDFKDEKEIVAAVNRIWENRVGEKYILEQQWYQQVAWFMGFQNLIWDRGTNRLYEPPVPSYRVRMVVNLILPAVMQLAAKIYRGQPEWDVLPATTDPDDIAIAGLDKNILEYNWTRMNMPAKMIEAIIWAISTGNVFLKNHWDPELGEEVVTTLEGEETLNYGDTQVDLVTPFEIFPEPGPTKMEDLNYILQTKVMSAEVIKERFPKYADKITLGGHEALVSHQFQFQEWIRRLSGNQSDTQPAVGIGVFNEDKVLVHELWIKPRPGSKNQREGRFCVIAGNCVVNGKTGVPFPYEHKQLPFIHIGQIYVPGRFWYTSTTEQMMALQSDYNRTKSQLTESRNLMSKPKWKAPKGHGVPKSGFTSEPGEVIEYNPGFEPKMEAAPPMPAYVQNILAEHRQDMEDVSGQHEVSRAEAPGQVRSGKGVLALIEQDESRLATTINHVNQALEKLGRQNLSVTAQFTSEQRLAKIVGVNDELLVFTYIGKQLVGQNRTPGINYFDVRVKTISGLPYSRTAQQGLLSELVQVGVLNGERDRKLILSMLSMGQVERVLDKSRIHRSKQLEENERMQNGEPVVPDEWQDHEIHLEVLNDFRNSARFNTMPDEIKALFAMHAEFHKELRAMQLVDPEIRVRRVAVQMSLKQGLAPMGGGQEQNNGQGKLREASQRNGSQSPGRGSQQGSRQSVQGR